MNNVPDLLYALMGLTLLFFAASSMAHIHLWDTAGKLKEDIRSLKSSMEIARDRVSYLYDQVSRVETKVDVQDTIDDLKETIEAFQQEENNRGDGVSGGP